MTYDMDADDQRIRTIEKNGKTFIVEQKDPFGFCYVTWDSTEKLPEDFDGAYTTFTEAFYAINIYADKTKNKPLPRKTLEAKLS